MQEPHLPAVAVAHKAYLVLQVTVIFSAAVRLLQQ